MTDLDRWRAKVNAASLTTELEDGVVVEPLYRAAPAAPVGRTHATSWRVAHEYAAADPQRVADAIAIDRGFGLAAAWVRLDASERARCRVSADTPRGTIVVNAAQVGRVLAAAGDDVLVRFDAGADGARVLGLLREAASTNARVLFDPLGAWAQLGALGLRVDEAIAELARSTTDVNTELLASGVPYHDAGATAAVEVGAAIGTAIEYVRAAVGQGVALDHACDRLVLRVTVDSDVFVSIAKLRAVRWLWRGVAKRWRSKATPQLSVRTALRNRTRRDPWVNLLRGTVEAFAAACGGADEVVVGAFDETIGRSSDDARRWAVLGQCVLREESELGVVDDPAAGCGYVEALTQQLATRAWALVREIEAVGGMAIALDRGVVQEPIREAAHRRRQLLARGRGALIGVSLHPDLDEPRVDAPSDPAPEADAREPVATVPRLASTRLAEPFEALRDASDAHLQRKGARPLALLVAIGSAAEHRARVDFARGAVTVGGFATQVVTPDAAQPAPLAVLCGADERLATDASSIAAALRRAGVQKILVAAPPTAIDDIDGFLHRGTEILSTMSDLQAQLGVGA